MTGDTVSAAHDTGVGSVRADTKSAASPWRRLVAAAAISTLGDGVHVVAFPLLAVTITTDPATIAAVAAAATLPTLVFAIPAGALVDRVSRGRLMVTVDLVRVGLLACLVGSIVTGNLAVWQLFVVASALGTAEVISDVAASAFVPSLVEPPLLPKVNAYLATVSELGNGVVGPAIGGLLFAGAAALPFGLNGLSFGLAALLVIRFAWPQSASQPASQPVGASDQADQTPPFLRQVADGFGWLYRHRGLRSVAIMVGAWSLFGWMPEGPLVLYATKVLGLGSGGFGLLFGASSVGAVLGGLVSWRVVGRIGLGPMLLLSVAWYTALLYPPAFLRSPIAVGAVFFAQGLPLLCWSVVSSTARQTLVPSELLGRVGSVFRLLGGGLAPVGMLAGGLVAGWLGLRAVFTVAGLGLTVAFAANFGGLRQLGRDAQARAAKGGDPQVGAQTAGAGGTGEGPTGDH